MCGEGDGGSILKIMKSFDNIKFENLFELAVKNSIETKWHKLKLKGFQTNVAENFFTYKIGSVWKFLLGDAVRSTSINMFF